MKTGYEWIYELTPLYEDLKRGGKNWYRLKWKPIKNGTYNLWFELTYKSWSAHLIGVRIFGNGAHNGWGRSWNGIYIEAGLYFCLVTFWLRWNFMCMKDGPSDVKESDKKPLDLSRLKTKK